MTRSAKTGREARAGLEPARPTWRASLAVFLGVLVMLLWLAPVALAGPWVHSPFPSQNIEGLDHACGAAVDSAGDVYASSAGTGEVKIFDETHVLLKSISNAHEPCALAVDSQGDLYVSERNTGEVVRYGPSEYPPTTSTTYAETAIDSSGAAKGISVDPTDDRLYVAEGNRVANFNSEGTPGIDEEQLIKIRNEGGTLTLSFEGGIACAPISAGASHAEMEACLKEILGEGNFSLKEGPVVEGLRNRYRVEFRGGLGGKDVPLLVADKSGMLGFKEVLISEAVTGWNGHIAEGELSGATGVAVFTYPSTPSRHYLFVAEPSEDKIGVFVGTDIRALEARQPIDGTETSANELGLAAESYLGVDPKIGHVFAYDAAHEVVNEFEATGQYFSQISSPVLPASGFEDAQPTPIAVDRSGGAGDGVVYVGSGASSGGELLAFKAAPGARRRELPLLSHEGSKACGAAVDTEGDVFVAEGAKISIYDSAGKPLGSIPEGQHPCGLAVDSEGNVYAVRKGPPPLEEGESEIVFYQPTSGYPFSGSATYGPPAVLEPSSAHLQPRGVAVDPTNDRLFVSHTDGKGISEYKSAHAGSGLVESGFCGLGGQLAGIDVYGKNGDIYVVNQAAKAITVCNADGSKIVNNIDGNGSPSGTFSDLSRLQIAVDQANGSVLVGEMRTRGAVEEYEASGAFVEKFGSFTKSVSADEQGDVALDDSGGATDGNLYVAFDDPANASDLTAFGPLIPGDRPEVVAEKASAVAGTGATLSGTIDPRGFDLAECKFDYLLDPDLDKNLEEGKPPFDGAEEVPCVPDPTGIGDGFGPVAVHAVLSGLQAGGRYRFRLVANNEFGEDEDEGLFGPPLVITDNAQPILYHEATLRGKVDTSGLATTYHFEYGTGEEFHNTSSITLTPSDEGYTAVEAPLVGLTEGISYHFRLVAESEDTSVPVAGDERSFETLEKTQLGFCPNETLRFENNSSHLPDCRAYELVTPADTRNTPHAEEFSLFNNWLVTLSGPMAGDSLAFFLFKAPLAGTEGNGERDGYRAVRGEEEWSSASYGPSAADGGESSTVPRNLGVAPDQRYWFYEFGGNGMPSGAFALGKYLRTPAGFEAVGQGSLGNDLHAEPAYVSAGGTHVLFTSVKHLEPEAAPEGTQALYDRKAGVPQADVVSLKPGGASFGPGEGATYLGATEDGSAVAFSAGGSLYLRRDGIETIEVAHLNFSFAGISADGSRVFYTTNSNGKEAAGLRVCEVNAGACSTVQIAENAKFVNVSADGSHAYLTSEEEVGGEGVPSAPNLYAWDDTGTKFIAVLSAEDFPGGGVPFPNTAELEEVGLDVWTDQCVLTPKGDYGRASCPSRTTPDGRFLVFQSHADLTPPYEAQGHSEIYRYDASDGGLLCASCDPSGVPAGSDADLQGFKWPDPRFTTASTTLIPGVTEDGKRAFFQTAAALLPEDANSVLDVYEWRAQEADGCKRPNGCLALISSGQGDSPSAIYSMTPDGHDVFISTLEKLIPSDVVGSPSIYDARVDGGFPQPAEKEACHGDACQPPPGPTPERASITSGVPNAGNEKPNSRCPRGRRRVRHNGRVRCLKRHRGMKRAHKRGAM